LFPPFKVICAELNVFDFELSVSSAEKNDAALRLGQLTFEMRFAIMPGKGDKYGN
jgi:hypothetical protein